MPVMRMAELMRDDAGDLVGALRLLQEPVEQVDLAARQCDGVWDRAGQHVRVERMLDPAGGPDVLDHFRERGPAFGRLADLASEYGSHLCIDCPAHSLFERIRHQWRQTIRGVRNAEDGYRDDRSNRGGGPEHDTQRLLGTATIGVERGRAGDDGLARRCILDLKTRQRGGRPASQTKPPGRTVDAADGVKRPCRDHSTVLNHVDGRAEAQRDLTLAVRRAVEIDGGTLLYVLHRHAPSSSARATINAVRLPII